MRLTTGQRSAALEKAKQLNVAEVDASQILGAIEDAESTRPGNPHGPKEQPEYCCEAARRWDIERSWGG